MVSAMGSKAKTGWSRGIRDFGTEHQNRVVLGLLVSKVIEGILRDAKPENFELATKYIKVLNSSLYVVSLKDKRYQIFEKT